MLRRIAIVAATLPALAGAQISVGRNVQVSTMRGGDTHFEAMVAADPKDPSRLIAGSHIRHADTTGQRSIAYASFDGGKTWQIALERRDSTIGADVALAYGPDGSAFFATLARGRGAFRSRDGGRTWGDPTKIPPSISLDREYIAADYSSKFRGRVYMNGTIYPTPIDTGGARQSAFGLYTSTDGGTTWGNPISKIVLRPEWILGMGNCVVLSDGSVISLFGVMKQYGYYGADSMTGASATLRVIASNDGGATLGSAVKVADFYMHRPRSEGAVLPTLAVDPGSTSFKDRLYAVWTDFRSKRLEILLAYSSDKGKTWSNPQVINDDRVAMDPTKGPDDMAPTVVVNKDGVVGVSWYDRRESPDNLGWNLRFRASLDGGDTWLSSVKVTESPSGFAGNEIWNASGNAAALGDTTKSGGKLVSLSARIDNFSFSPGHNSGLAADANGAFHPVWIDNRTGVAQMWTAPVTVSGAVALNGGGELKDMREMAGRLSLELANSAYDRRTNRLTFSARLKNAMKTDTVRGPVKIRVLSVRSDIGVPEIMNANNGVRGPGAIFDLSSLLPAGGLLPDSLSKPTDLVIQLSEIRPLKQGSVTRSGIATFEARVFGPQDAKAALAGKPRTP